MRKEMHILVTCTKRKSKEPLPSLMMRKIRQHIVQDQVSAWVERLCTVNGNCNQLPAEDLYIGDHWKTAKDLTNIASTKGFRTNLWVISAGYGLINGKTHIWPYSAAFSPGHPDCVTKDNRTDSAADGFSEWWRLLSKWRGPDPSKPRTLTALFQANRNAYYIVVASELYFQAIKDDLGSGIKELGAHPEDKCIVISAGTRNFGPIAACSLPVDARLQSCVGGARRSLNIRIARKVIEQISHDRGLARVRSQFVRLMRDTKKPVQIQRTKVSDSQVCKFITQNLDQKPYISASSLLSLFRTAGWACEQRRFGELCRQVKETRNGH